MARHLDVSDCYHGIVPKKMVNWTSLNTCEEKEKSVNGKIGMETVRRDEVYEAQRERENNMI